MSKELVIGSAGQLGFDLMRTHNADRELVGVAHDGFDVCDFKAVECLMKEHRPSVVINTAAFHRIEECEQNPEKSFSVNAVGALNIARAAAVIDARVVFISTNYVFDGNQSCYDEDDVPNPLNIYGASKLAGEILTKMANPQSYIVRTSGLFGVRQSGKGYNFVTLMLEKSRRGEQIMVVNDEFTSVTYTRDLACQIKALIDKKALYGIYHLVNEGYCSWYEFARKIFEVFGIDANLCAISSQDRPSFVRRPKYSGLISCRLERIGIANLRVWELALKAYAKEVGVYVP